MGPASKVWNTCKLYDQMIRVRASNQGRVREEEEDSYKKKMFT